MRQLFWALVVEHEPVSGALPSRRLTNSYQVESRQADPREELHGRYGPHGIKRLFISNERGLRHRRRGDE